MAALWLLLASPLALRAAEVRVGIVAFQDFREAAEQYEQLFEQLSRDAEGLEFRVALGTYSDVLHWLRKDAIDLAIVSPGLYAQYQRTASSEGPADRFRYLVTEELPAAGTPWAHDDRRTGDFHSFYRSVCVTNRASSLSSTEALKRAVENGETRLLFVHPFSASGYLAPRLALGELGIELPEDVAFSHSHTGSLRAVAAAEGDEVVAFVWDDALPSAPELADRLKRLPLEPLEQTVIPADAVLARESLQDADRIKQLLLEYSDREEERRFREQADWAQRAEQLAERGVLEESSEEDFLQRVSLNEIGDLLVHYARTQSAPPRLAVVLPGGGAKCSYQVGAVTAVEEKLAEIRTRYPELAVDINLVVGTSGGAINALPVALGVTRTEEGRRDFRRTWLELDQRDIVTPSFLLRVNIGLWFALAEAGCLLFLVRRTSRSESRQGWRFGFLVLSLGVVQLALAYARLPFEWLGHHHAAHHAWLWITFGLPTTGWTLVLLGSAVLGIQSRRRREGRHLTIPLTTTRWLLLVGLVGLPFIQLVTVFFFEDTLSRGRGMEHALATHVPRLVSREVERRGLTELEGLETSSDAQRMQATSRAVLRRGLLQRDLVVTGSCIEQSPAQLPSDLYFFAAAPGSKETSRPASDARFGTRGVALAEHPTILLDVIAGSGSIFPMFPARTIRDFPERGGHVALVDGGFAHNSPIEAAVLWGATHIIVIESKPKARVQRGNFLQNALASFVHLHHQAQLQDTRSRGRVALFVLEPEPPHLCVLDFAANLIAESIDRGYRDAAGRGGEDPPELPPTRSFRKELGEPLFFP